VVVSGQPHSSVLLLPGKSYRYPFYRRMQAILQKMYAKDFYVHKLIIHNVIRKLHNVRYRYASLNDGDTF